MSDTSDQSSEEQEPEHCDDCGEPLEASQIGLCDACQSASKEPDEDAITVHDQRGSAKLAAYQYGARIAEFLPESRDAVIRAWMHRSNFYPDCYQISDHGNAHRITFTADSDPMRVVYVGSIGWRDCDPMSGFAGFDQESVNARIAGALDEERERANDSWEPVQCADCEHEDSTAGDDMESCQCGDLCDCDDPDLDDLIDYGIGVFSLADVIRDCIGYGSGDEAEKLAELMSDGITSY